MTLEPQLVHTQYVAAVRAGLPQEMTRTIGALAIASGATIDEFHAAVREAIRGDSRVPGGEPLPISCPYGFGSAFPVRH